MRSDARASTPANRYPVPADAFLTDLELHVDRALTSSTAFVRW